MTRQFFSRLRSLWNWNRKESELDEEIQFHLSEEADERAAAGLDCGPGASRGDQGLRQHDPHPRGDARRLGLGVRRAPDPGRSWRASDDATRSGLFRVGGADARARRWSDDGHPQRRGGTAPAAAAVRRRRSAGRAVRYQSEAGRLPGHHFVFRHLGVARREPRVHGHRGLPAGPIERHRRRPTRTRHGLARLRWTVASARREPGDRPDIRRERAARQRCRRFDQPRAVDAALRQRPPHPEQNHSPQRGQPLGHRRAPIRLPVPGVPGDGRAPARARASVPQLRLPPCCRSIETGRAGRHCPGRARRDCRGPGKGVPRLE